MRVVASERIAGMTSDFNPSALPHYDEEQVERARTEHPDLYENHLLLAQHLAGWADRVDVGEEGGQVFGFVDALREVSAHLRQADYIPGGELDS